MIKSVYDRNVSRSKNEPENGGWVQKEQIALSIAVFTSNTYYESTEKSEVKRVINMSFGRDDVSSDKGESFKELFNVSDNEGYKNSDFGAFEAFGREFFHQVKEKYHEEIFEDILNIFLKSLDIEEVLFDYDDSEELNKNIDDIYRQAIIDLIIEDFNYQDRYHGEISNSNDVNGEISPNRKDKFIRVVEDKRIPYLSMTKNHEFVRVTGRINPKLKKKEYKFDNMNIRTILNLFKEYNTGIDSSGKNIKYVNIPIDLLGL